MFVTHDVNKRCMISTSMLKINVCLKNIYYNKMKTCPTCKKIFSQSSSLNRHIKTAVCSKEKIKVKHSYVCRACHKELSSRQRLDGHIKICTDNSSMMELEQKVEKLNKKIEKLSEKATTTNIIVNNTDNSTNKTITTNNYSSLLDCTPENITEKFIKHYNTVKHLLDNDQKDLAIMTVEHLLSGKDQPMYYVADRSRNKFMYTDKENNEKEDANANLLRRLVYKGLKPIVNSLYEKHLVELNNNLLKYLRKDDRDMIASIRNEIKELEESFMNANILKEGEDYVTQLSKCLPTSIKDRLYQDSIDLGQDEESDQEFQLRLKEEIRTIGNYTVNELKKYKNSYRETRQVFLPPEIRSDPKYKEILAFVLDKE